MRNHLRLIVFLAMAAMVAGCAGGTAKPVEPVANDEERSPNLAPKAADLTADQQLIQEILKKNGFARSKSTPTILLVHKLSRKLTLYQGTTPRKTFSVVLGADPFNDKLCQGDSCTPEGVYRVVAKFPHPRWSRFILIDYPNNQSWLKFGRAKQAGKIPGEADIGGQVGIHGTDDDLKNLIGQNWTKGCVSLLNQDVEELYPWVSDNTLVVIKK